MENRNQKINRKKTLLLVSFLLIITLGLAVMFQKTEKLTDEEAAKSTVLAYFNALNDGDEQVLREVCTESYLARNGINGYTYEIVDITYEPQSPAYAVVRQRMKWNGYEDDEWMYLQISFRAYKKEGFQVAYMKEGYLYEDFGIWLLRGEKTGKWKILETGY